MRKVGTTFAVLAALSAFGFAIIPNNGLDTEFAFVGRNQFGSASAVAVGPNAVMTAQHVNLNEFITFSADATAPLFQVNLASVTDIDNTDIRLYRTVDTLPGWYDIDFSPLPVAFTHTEDASGDLDFQQNGGGLAAELRGVGFGRTGTPNAGGTGYDLDSGSAMVRRQARFWSDSRGDVTLGARGPFSSIISFLLENGDGTVESGDSGGGLFRNVGGVWKLVGINSFAGGNRLFGTGWTNERLLGTNPTLGHISGFAELAPHQAEIQAFLVPEPGSLAAIGFGLAALLRKKKISR